LLLDFDPGVTGISSQPFMLHWHDGTRERKHTPDYFARRADGSALVVDVKADDHVSPEDAEVFAVTEMMCREAGWEFRRAGEPDPLLTANVGWLAGYRNPRFGTSPLAARVAECFSSPAPLFEGAARAGDRLATLPVAYHLLWRQALVTDMHSALLGPGSIVRSGGCL
jgi:TnsA endonuclease-like protein